MTTDSSTTSSAAIEVDQIICGDYVVTMNMNRDVIQSGAIAIRENRIIDVGPIAQINASYSSKKHEIRTGIVLPGLINCHAHAAMTLFRGAADDCDLDGFLKTVWEMELKHISPNSVFAAAKLGMTEMLESGITSCVDMYWHPLETARAAGELGIRVSTGEVFVDFPGADGITDWDARIDRANNLADAYKEHPRITPILCPHSTYNLDESKLRELADLSAQKNLPVHVHASEAQNEMETVKKLSGTTPIGVLDRAGLLNSSLLIAHAVHVDDSEIQKIAESGASIAHCPLSNMKLASGAAPISEFIEAGINVALGTDGAATSNDLNLWLPMRVAALLQKLVRSDPQAMPAPTIVEAATLSGAKAMGKGEVLGSLEIGKWADIIGISLDKPHAQQLHDVYSHLVYSARPDDVEFVCVDGELLIDGVSHRECDLSAYATRRPTRTHQQRGANCA